MSLETTIAQTVAAYSTLVLQHVRRTLEAEMLAACHAWVKGTQAHVGQIELLTAVGAELDKRGALLPPPAFVDTCVEDGIRYSMQVRVF